MISQLKKIKFFVQFRVKIITEKLIGRTRWDRKSLEILPSSEARIFLLYDSKTQGEKTFRVLNKLNVTGSKYLMIGTQSIIGGGQTPEEKVTENLNDKLNSADKTSGILGGSRHLSGGNVGGQFQDCPKSRG